MVDTHFSSKDHWDTEHSGAINWSLYVVADAYANRDFSSLGHWNWKLVKIDL